MKEEISDPRKLAAKADKFWQASSIRSVNAVSPLLWLLLVQMILSTLFDSVLNLNLLLVLLLILPHVLYVLRPPVQPTSLLVSLHTWGSGSTLQNSLHVGSGKLTGWQEVHALPAGDSNLVFLQDSLSGWRFRIDT